MANNPYVNKVQTADGTTIIDITDTTATASDVAQGKYFYSASGARTEGTGSGGGGGVTITDEPNATGITCVITSGGSPVPPTPETWETVFNGTAYANADQPYNYFWIADMTNVYPTIGSEWRVTINGTPYRCTAYLLTSNSMICIGNPKYSGGTDDGNPIPANFYNAGWGAMVGDTELVSGVQHAIKFERLVED